MRKSELNRVGTSACTPSALPTDPGRASEDVLRAALRETTTDVVLVIDESSNILQVNPRCQPVLGYRCEELVGQPVDRLMPKRLRAAHAHGVARYLRTGTRTIDWSLVEVTALCSDGPGAGGRHHRPDPDPRAARGRQRRRVPQRRPCPAHDRRTQLPGQS